MKDLLYIKDNSNIPWGVVSSTARLGAKWLHQVSPGDVVNLKVVDGESLGKAIVINVVLKRYEDVIKEAHHNHAAWHCGDKTPGETLDGELRAAYPAAIEQQVGDGIPPDTVFSVVHILPINPADGLETVNGLHSDA